MPQFTAEEADVEELDEHNSDVDTGSTTPLMNDDFWDSQHPNSPLFTPLQQIPRSQHILFNWALKKLTPLRLYMKKFQPLVLMKLLLLNL